MNSKKTPKSFEEATKIHSGLINKLANKLYRKFHKYSKYSIEEYHHLVNTAAWLAWKKQVELTNEATGESPQAFGSYLETYILFVYKSLYMKERLKTGKELESVYDRSKVTYNGDFEQIDDKDFIEFHVSKMDRVHQDVYKYRYVDGLTLKETGIKMDISHEYVRQIEVDLIQKIQNKISLLND